MAMGHVILKEFYVDRQVPYFQQYARKYTDLPMLKMLRERGGAEGGAYVSNRFLHAADLGEGSRTPSGRPSSWMRGLGAGRAERLDGCHGEEGAGSGTLSSATLTLCSRCSGLTTSSPRWTCSRFDVGDTDEGGAVMRAGAYRPGE